MRRWTVTVLACSWVAAIIALAAIRIAMSAPPVLQFIGAIVVWAGAALPAMWLLPGHGFHFVARSRISNGVGRGSLLLAIAAIIAVQSALPDLWPVLAVCVLLPALIIGQLAIDWKGLGEVTRIGGD